MLAPIAPARYGISQIAQTTTENLWKLWRSWGRLRTRTTIAQIRCTAISRIAIVPVIAITVPSTAATPVSVSGLFAAICVIIRVAVTSLTRPSPKNTACHGRRSRRIRSAQTPIE